MDIRRLEIFLKLLDTRSFSKTATALGLTQPSVSASLKSLEESLGQKLFERTPRTVTPLASAEILAPYAISIVETASQAAWAVNRQLVNAREKLALGASSLPALVFMPPAMAVFSGEYPNVFIKLKTGQSHGIAQKVADGELDLGLVGAPPEIDELTSTVFSRDKLVLLASKGLADKIGASPKTVEDLARWPLIMREEGSGTKAAFLTATGSPAVQMDIRAEVEGLGPLLALVGTSFGAAVISSLLIPLINPQPQNMVAMKLDFLSGRRFFLIRRRTSQLSPAVDAFIGLLKQERPAACLGNRGL